LWNTTVGLKVPADSHVLPCGEIIGSFEARFHGPKGMSAFWAATAREASSRVSAKLALSFPKLIIFIELV
jgi:hypothetical protein